MSAIGNAAAWVVDYTCATYWQARELVFRTDPTPYRSGSDGMPAVLLLPGIYETWQFMRPLAQQIHDLGHPVHVVTKLGSNRRSVVASAALVDAYLRQHDLTDVIIVAHSKGGLIGKYLMTDVTSKHRVDRMIAIATPFGGSAYARYVPFPALRAFSPADATTLMLTGHLDVNARITSVFGTFDPHIPGGSALDGAHNIRLPVAGHFRILASPELKAAVAEFLRGAVSERARRDPPS